MPSTEEHDLDPAIENRMFGRYADAECIVISAFTELDQDLNLLRKCGVSNHKLRNTISRSGYRYVPVWGGFRRADSGKVIQVQAYIVFNYHGRSNQRATRQENCLELKCLAKSWCVLFDQTFYLYKEEGITARGIYTDCLGSEIRTFEDLDPIKAVDAYFAALQQSAKESKEEPLTLNYVKGDIYTAPDPCNLMGAMGRGIAGEIIFMPTIHQWR